MSTAHVLTTTRRGALGLGAGLTALGGALAVAGPVLAAPTATASTRLDTGVTWQIGRASCRERV